MTQGLCIGASFPYREEVREQLGEAEMSEANHNGG